MDTTPRTILKSITWQVMGILTGTLIGYLFTGSVAASGGIAVTGALTGAVFYVVHEKIWARIRWGLRHGIHAAHGRSTAAGGN